EYFHYFNEILNSENDAEAVTHNISKEKLRADLIIACKHFLRPDMLKLITDPDKKWQTNKVIPLIGQDFGETLSRQLEQTHNLLLVQMLLGDDSINYAHYYHVQDFEKSRKILDTVLCLNTLCITRHGVAALADDAILHPLELRYVGNEARYNEISEAFEKTARNSGGKNSKEG
ncbi:MAG: hypothetical protein ACPGXY_05935, partial [Alphaproteobacteria bacterium]